MKPKIEKPHIFISYAWGSQENQQKVIDFAKSLTQCGINVELDKWSLKEGNDTYAYMEQMVNNPDITNVLMLLDENYTKKANERKGGVGTETQILSPEIYEKVDQNKFIPVVFSRGPNGEIYKPTFLKQIFHFDLSIDENYSTEFQRLVKRLFGIEIIEKPELGKPPAWLEEDKQSVEPRIAFTKILNSKNDKERLFEIKNALSDIKNKIIDTITGFSIERSNYIELYKQTQSYRDSFLSLMNLCIWFDNFEKEIASFLEELKNARINSGVNNDMKDTLIHEVFIYVVGMYLKTQNYNQLKYLLKKTYFPEYRYEEPTSFNHFYINNQMLDNVVCQRDNKIYYSGTAQLWMETINLNSLSRNEFIGADDLLYNIVVFAKDCGCYRHWFPISYVYDDTSKIINDMGRRLASKEHLEIIKSIFGYDDLQSFIDAITTTVKSLENRERYRYSAAWRYAPLITDFIKLDEIGKYN